MKSLLQLRHIRVENANAITGMTWGFPGIANFLGFTHALSRKLEQEHGVRLGGCAVICHEHQVQAYQPGGWGEHVFALTRNPLTRAGQTAPFNEEGRMHMTVSLLIECEFDADDLALGGDTPEQNITMLQRLVHELALRQRLAGGSITGIGQVHWLELEQDQKERTRMTRRLMLGLLPGFALVDRHDLLQAHHRQRQEQSADTQLELLDSLLDFVALKYRAETQEDHEKPEWQRQAKPAAGYLVPMAVGYQAISPLYEAGTVANSRDSDTPFRFVESVYSLGQWLSPHRVEELETIFWYYRYQDELYLCCNAYQEDDEELNDFVHNF